MSIEFNRYIDITSGVGAGAAVPQRELIARLITTNIEAATGSVLEFNNSSEVSDYFGSGSPEALRAAFYFAFVSKTITQPNNISFARWANADTAPRAAGAPVTATLAELQAVTAGEFDLTLGITTETVSAIDLSGDASFAAVAATVQAAVRAASLEAIFTAATVTYDATRSRFILTGGATGPAVIAISATGASPVLADLLGWTTGVTLSNGVSTETITDTLANSTELTNNFGSFAFVPALTEDQVVEAATWNDGNNLLFQYHTGVLPADAATLMPRIINLGGTGVTLLIPSVNEFPELLPMAALAATDYNRRASVINYMYLQAALSPSVTTTADANLYDGLRINYYGQTQTAGQQLSFYQRGFLTGQGTDPVNMNTFANEQWLKDFAGSQLLSLLLSLPRVSANAAGRGQVLSILRDVVDQALINGTISVGRTLTAQQRVFISEQTGDPSAFQQVQTSGYWLDASIESRVVNSVTEFFVLYTLIYSKDEVVRAVDGSHILV